MKGILTCGDSKEALKHDVQGIIVSNHGGRQLGGVQAAVGLVNIFFVSSLLVQKRIIIQTIFKISNKISIITSMT